MATTKYRLSVPIEVETRKALDRLARSMNASRGKTAGSFLDQLVPQMYALADLVDRARENPDPERVRSELLDILNSSTTDAQMEISGLENPQENKNRGSR